MKFNMTFKKRACENRDENIRGHTLVTYNAPLSQDFGVSMGRNSV